MQKSKRQALTGVDITPQIPLLEKRGPHWCLWLEYNPDFTSGVYLRLMQNGAIWREEINKVGQVTKQIKPVEE